jgi:predicted nucleotidyltransferase
MVAHEAGIQLQMTYADPDQVAKAEAIDFARRLVGRWQEMLGAELIGAYLIGSLAHGGFSRRNSDVDLGLVTATGLAAPMLDRLRSEAAALSAEWGPKVSIFWTDRHFSLGRFPPLDRIDYLDHAVALIERERVEPARPTLAEIRGYLRGAPFAGWAARAQSFAAAQALAPQDRKAYVRALLYPARLCFSWITGRMGTNDEAMALLRQRPVGGLDIVPIERALQCRATPPTPTRCSLSAPRCRHRSLLAPHCLTGLHKPIRPAQGKRRKQAPQIGRPADLGFRCVRSRNTVASATASRLPGWTPEPRKP